MNEEKKGNFNVDSYKLEVIKISSIDKREVSDVVNKEIVDKFNKNNSEKLAHIEKLVMILTDRVKNIEKDIALKELEGKLNKHYEQSRRC